MASSQRRGLPSGLLGLPEGPKMGGSQRRGLPSGLLGLPEGPKMGGSQRRGLPSRLCRGKIGRWQAAPDLVTRIPQRGFGQALCP